MEHSAYEQAALFEHRFWLQILGDHSRFIFNSLAPAEKTDIQAARNFIQVFDQLLCQAREANSYSQLSELTDYAYEYARKLRCFKLDLLRRQLVSELGSSLPPTFFNHMLNELEEYLWVLKCLQVNEIPALAHPIHHDLLWISDAVFHAETLAARLDPVESTLKTASECFIHDFKELYLKALEIKGYLRTGEKEFPALTKYNLQVVDTFFHFNNFLCKLLSMLSQRKALSILTPLTPDHMLREECYFLTKLAQVSGVKLPEGDPTRPRIES